MQTLLLQTIIRDWTGRTGTLTSHKSRQCLEPVIGLGPSPWHIQRS